MKQLRINFKVPSLLLSLTIEHLKTPTYIKRLICISMFFIHFNAFSRSLGDTLQPVISNPYIIEMCVDKMTDEPLAKGSKVLVCSKTPEKGFILSINWIVVNDKPFYNGITIKSFGLGNCVENSILYFLFEDDSKFTFDSWNKYNCDGISTMDLFGKYLFEITRRKIKALRFQNGRNFESYTYDVPEIDQRFFLEVAQAVNNQVISRTSCDY